MEINYQMLEQMRAFEVDQLTWYLYENDGGHVEGSQTLEGEIETGVVKDTLIKIGFSMPIIDDAMIKHL
jgi:hypothetical protein